MSGGPPHHPPPHGRQAPPTAATNAWNHLQVPNFFPTRQPQLAHMPSEHSLLHQPPTWHTPTTEPSTMKTSMAAHSHIFSLEQMLSERQFPRQLNTAAPCVDLTLQRNGGTSSNGDLLPVTAPISLSVRDTHKINSLPVSAFDVQPIEVALISPRKSLSPNELIKCGKPRASKRVDSIAERLNTTLDKQAPESGEKEEEASGKKSVIVQAGSHDENSNSSSLLNVPTRGDEDSNEDSLDNSGKSRRKRKPSKTVRLAKDEEEVPVKDAPVVEDVAPLELTTEKSNEGEAEKTRRKTSESETIDNIAAMVQKGLDEPNTTSCVSVIKSSSETSDLSNSSNNVTTTEQKTTATEEQQVATTSSTANQFVEVEDKLEEMFAGIEDVNNASLTTTTDNVTSTSSEIVNNNSNNKKLASKKKKTSSAGNNKRRKQRGESFEANGKKKPLKKQQQTMAIQNKAKLKKSLKSEVIKDVYAYDSGSNASSSRSRGPFIQIRGPRDSPLSVSVINTLNDGDDGEKKANKSKKFHDDSEYRHKVRSKGLHCSTLSHQYDAQTKDATWICAFCKRGPHATETTGPTLNCAVPAPGDLFGPYIISAGSVEFEKCLSDPYDKQFKSKKIARSLSSEVGKAGRKMGGKRKLSIDSSNGSGSAVSSDFANDTYFGITETPLNNGTFEIWAHEDCIVWSSGIYLIGPKIIGLEEAVWTSCNVVCVRCQLKGANICCLKRGCVQVAHVCCARMTNWWFDEENYKTFCPEHRVANRI